MSHLLAVQAKDDEFLGLGEAGLTQGEIFKTYVNGIIISALWLPGCYEDGYVEEPHLKF